MTARSHSPAQGDGARSAARRSRRRVACAAAALAVLGLLGARAGGAERPSIAFYYGPDQPLAELALFDRVVLDPGHTDRAAIERLRASGSRVYAYLSVGEAGPWVGEGVPSDWVLGRNPNWDTVIMDLAAAGWRERLVERRDELTARGFDGLFLDTTDSHRRALELPGKRASRVDGLVTLVKALRGGEAGARLLINRGFRALSRVADELDGVVAESLYRGWDPARKEYRAVPEGDRRWLLERLRAARDRHGLPVTVIERKLMPDGKPVRSVLWSGDCLVGESAIAIAERGGYAHINGRGASMTRRSPTVTRMGPWTRPLGNRVQVYAPIANENDPAFTDGWTKPYTGYRRVIGTFELTEAPRRLKPIGIYYHFYSGANRAGLNALKRVYRWVRRQTVFPVHVHEFTKKVKGMRRAAVARRPDGRWRVAGLGALRTLRVPAAAGLPRFAACRGVAGFRRVGDRRYLHLTGDKPVILSLGAEKAGRPYLRQANGRLLAWSVKEGEILLRVRAHRPARVEIAGPARPGKAWGRDGSVAPTATEHGWSYAFRSGDTGPIRIPFEAGDQ